ncbi:N-6 DNA methylase [Luxibacter massiliensis]|uniref:N-6 DNA methylase n=1 Tax=Luxibacter massiliensis TaxID=2219695 RepID=UPI000F0575D4|nr:N-6 DNA methylase [Luxibacter massiliensis]
MIEELRVKIAKYVNKNANLKYWQDIREYYARYSYLAFAAIITYKLIGEASAKDIQEIFIENGFEKLENIDFIVSTLDASDFVAEVMESLSDISALNINNVYQGFLSRDYELKDGVFTFEGGKNHRDVLGSYYTQENFAKEIATKAINDFMIFSNKEQIRIADFSCGGGAFLVSACEICNEKGISQEIYGYDVDPIAVMITRYRLFDLIGDASNSDRIVLGNPLMRADNDLIYDIKFQSALTGHFYNRCMSVAPVNNIDIVLGNPPWEKIRFEDKKFLRHYSGEDAIGTKSEREAYLKGITEENLQYYEGFVNDYRQVKDSIKKDPFFSGSSCGELNTYALFTELCLKLLSDEGIAGIIIKTSLLKMPVYSTFFGNMTRDGNIREIYMFVNRKKIFNIDSREEFSVIYLGAGKSEDIGIALDLDKYEEFASRKRIYASHQLLRKLNPDTGMLPNISNGEELKFLISLYDNNQIFGATYPDCKFGRLVHLTNHSDYIVKHEEPGYLPIYEGKFIEIYTAKFATFGNMTDDEKYKNKASARAIEDIEGDEYPDARFFIDENAWKNLSKNFENDYIVAWRSLTSATNRRTMLATALPLVPVCQSIQLLQLTRKQMRHVLAVFNSIVFDYIVRLKMVGLDLTQTIIRQIPVPKEERYENIIIFSGVEASIEEHINSRIKVLYASDNRMSGLFDHTDTYMVNSSGRKQILSELDSLVAILYRIKQEDLRNIAISFNKFYDKNEIEEFF